MNSGLTSKALSSQWNEHHQHQHLLVAFFFFFSFLLFSLLYGISLLSKLLGINSVLVLRVHWKQIVL